MVTKLYDKMPGYIKESGNFKASKKESKSFLLISCFLLSGGIRHFVIDNV
jgi:hypothetical protein